MRALVMALLVMGCRWDLERAAAGLDGAPPPADSPAGDAPPIASDGLVLGHFGPPARIDDIVDPIVGEDDPSLTEDLLELYFDRGADVWRARRSSVTDPWVEIEPVPELNSFDAEATPEVSPDGLAMYFGSNRLGGIGEEDVYASRRPSRTEPWTPPVRVPELASVGRDVSPIVSVDATSMILASSRAGGLGALDMWAGTWSGTAWGDPVPMEAPFNTAFEDSGGMFDAARSIMVFWSRRDGNDELYVSYPPFVEIAPLVDLNTTSGEQDPWLSPDGRTIVFASNRDGIDHLYVSTR